MKKLLLYASLIVVLFVGLYALNVAANGSKDNPYGVREHKLQAATRALLDDPNYQNIIKPDELESKLKNGYSGLILFFKSDCPHCKVTIPKIMPVANELGIDLPLYNLLEYPQGWTTYGLEWTPTLVYFKDGVQADGLVGGVEETPGDGGITMEDYTEFLQSHSE